MEGYKRFNSDTFSTEESLYGRPPNTVPNKTHLILTDGDCNKEICEEIYTTSTS